MSAHDRSTLQIAEWVHSVQRPSIPVSSVEALTWHHLDSIGCAIGAMNADPCVAVLGLATDSPSSRGTSVLGSPTKVAPEWAAYANTAMIRYLDFNDNYFRMGGGHTSDIIPALWAVAELAGASGPQLIEGMYAGYETHMALADAVDLRDRGWDYPSFIAVAAAAGAARILGLTVDQTAHAIAMAVTGSSAPLGVNRVGRLSNWKALSSSHATTGGLMAARLAGRGITGPSHAIEGHRGLWALVTGEFSLNIGEPLNGYLAAERSAYKLHVADYTAQIVAEEFIELHRKGITPDDVESVRIAVPWVAWSECGGGQDDHAQKWDPLNKETADHSIPYVAAVALVDGYVQVSSYDRARLMDPALRPVMAKIEVVANEEISRTWHLKPTNVIAIKLRSGVTHEIRTDYPRGHHLNPATHGELTAKFHYQALGVVAPIRTAGLLPMLLQLDSQTSLETMFTGLREVRQKPLE